MDLIQIEPKRPKYISEIRSNINIPNRRTPSQQICSYEQLHPNTVFKTIPLLVLLKNAIFPKKAQTGPQIKRNNKKVQIQENQENDDCSSK